MSAPAESSGADLARSALQSARAAARKAGQGTVKRPATKAQVARQGRLARDPARLDVVLPGLVAARGWDVAAAGGTVLDRWAELVGPDRAAHWSAVHYDDRTRTLTVLADSPSWATTLRLTVRQVIATLDQHLEAGTVRSIAVRNGSAPEPALRHRPDPVEHPQRPLDPVLATARPAPLADQAAYQQLRQQMREQAQARQVALDEAAARREQILRDHYNRLREPETLAGPPVDQVAQVATARQRRSLDSHHAALAVARAARAGAVPLRTIDSPQPSSLTGAA
ncbi:DciA family protein [Kitasatospora sp. NPDC004669]|uniref:DciA family protein n=1 Tax=Kitasatospora sp. NPDC004669 TaxID=3154555 RepID=UPI0033A0C86A